jgi:hypothetical protein
MTASLMVGKYAQRLSLWVRAALKSDLTSGCLPEQQPELGAILWLYWRSHYERNEQQFPCLSSERLSKFRTVKKGMKMIIPELLLGLDTSGTFEVTIRSNIPNFENITFDVVSIADRWKSNDLSGESIELDMHTDHPLEYIEYWATIERGSARPLESNFGCCGSRPAWRQYFDFSGYGDTDGLGSSSQVTGQTNGFVWKVNLGCDDFQWVCELEALGDYETKSVIARALQFRAALFAYSLILNSGTTVNLCTLYKSEEIAGHRNFLNNKYAEYIQYASENIPNGASSCFSCSKSAFTLTDIHL